MSGFMQSSVTLPGLFKGGTKCCFQQIIIKLKKLDSFIEMLFNFHELCELVYSNTYF